MFKEIPGYDGNYKINEAGVILNKKEHMMRPIITDNGYLRTALEIYDENGKLIKRNNEFVHRLVAKTFIPNPDNLPIVMHLDNDTLNPCVTNLKWGTQKENVEQCVKEGRNRWGRYSEGTRSSLFYKQCGSPYSIYNNKETIYCSNRNEVALRIEYELVSLKNMVGNGRVISKGPYQGYQIKREKSVPAFLFNN